MRCGWRRAATKASVSAWALNPRSAATSCSSATSMRCVIRSRCTSGMSLIFFRALCNAVSLISRGRASNCARIMPMRAVCIVLPLRTAACSVSRVRCWFCVLSSFFLAVSSPLSLAVRNCRALRIRPSLDAMYLSSTSSVNGISTSTGSRGSRIAMRNCCSCGWWPRIPPFSFPASAAGTSFAAFTVPVLPSPLFLGCSNTGDR
mmetsp:Transcript_43885/g.87971  ORF Transcript_43885/g.87971 Transcript_43885/m.87971 type:complete len:204 (-) Transcript_43885:305-916(-)